MSTWAYVAAQTLERVHADVERSGAQASMVPFAPCISGAEVLPVSTHSLIGVTPRGLRDGCDGLGCSAGAVADDVRLGLRKFCVAGSLVEFSSG